MSKNEKCTCKACKTIVFHSQICKFMTFFTPSSSWLRKFPIISGMFWRNFTKIRQILACGEQTHFSALVSPAEKIAIFSAGETRAEKCVCFPQASRICTPYKFAQSGCIPHNATFSLVKVREQLAQRREIIAPDKTANQWNNSTS